MAVLAAILIGPVKAFAADPVVVVELFTSQGCYSCPPADSYLGELAEREGVLALGYHVTYWDRLGWPDRYGTVEGTERQYTYARNFPRGRPYTPQMVIGGTFDAVGSSRRSVERSIASARKLADSEADIDLSWAGGGILRVSIDGGSLSGKAEIVLVRFDRKHTTKILRGENGGKTLNYHQVVREFRRLGDYNGSTFSTELNLSGGDAGGWGVAVLLQEKGQGRILGAAQISGGAGSSG